MPAGHSLTLKLHFIRFRLLIVEPTILRLYGSNPGHTTHKKKHPLRGDFFWWEWLDSNQLRLKPTDLQSAPALQLRRTPNLVKIVKNENIRRF